MIDLAKPEGQELVATSPVNELTHSEPVSEVHWVSEKDPHRKVYYRIVSVGTDGKVLLWSFSKGSLTLIQRYLM